MDNEIDTAAAPTPRYVQLADAYIMGGDDFFHAAHKRSWRFASDAELQGEYNRGWDDAVEAA